jgi:hypothetical protein
MTIAEQELEIQELSQTPRIVITSTGCLMFPKSGEDIILGLEGVRSLLVLMNALSERKSRRRGRR